MVDSDGSIIGGAKSLWNEANFRKKIGSTTISCFLGVNPPESTVIYAADFFLGITKI